MMLKSTVLDSRSPIRTPTCTVPGSPRSTVADSDVGPLYRVPSSRPSKTITASGLKNFPFALMSTDVPDTPLSGRTLNTS